MNELNKILVLNGASTTLAGILLLIFPNQLSAIFGMDLNTYFISVGLFFTVFGIFVLFNGFQKKTSTSNLRFITAVDWLWVIVSAIIIVALYDKITMFGMLIVVAIALWVLVMAILEGKFLKKST